jgi:hypothetical protein
MVGDSCGLDHFLEESSDDVFSDLAQLEKRAMVRKAPPFLGIG